MYLVASRLYIFTGKPKALQNRQAQPVIDLGTWTWDPLRHHSWPPRAYPTQYRIETRVLSECLPSPPYGSLRRAQPAAGLQEEHRNRCSEYPSSLLRAWSLWC